MAVCENVRNGKAFESARAGGLDYTHICDIMGGESVEFNFQSVIVAGGIMFRKYAVGYGVFSCGFPVNFCVARDTTSVFQENTAVNKLCHEKCIPFVECVESEPGSP